MLSKCFKMLRIKIRYDEKANGFAFFVPFSTLMEPYEDFVDFVTLLSYIVPTIHFNIGAKKAMTIKTIVKFLRIGEQALKGITECEPFDLVDIESDDNIVKIQVR